LKHLLKTFELFGFPKFRLWVFQRYNEGYFRNKPGHAH